MRVLYDVTVLGNAQRDLWQRTGVFRVVDEVARQLAQSKECDLNFCCAIDPGRLEDARRYVAGDRTFQDIPLLGNRFAQSVNFSERRPRGSAGIQRGFRGLGYRALHKCVSQFGKLSSAFSSRAVDSFDIFHAPAFYLPAFLRRCKRVKSLLTIYDLIPIIFPELCREGSREFMERALSSLLPHGRAICISEATKNDLCNCLPNFDSTRATVIPLAASDKFYPCKDISRHAAIRAKYNIPEDPYFLSLSTLEPRKNLDHLIQCFSSLINESQLGDCRLVLVGEKGWAYEKIFESLATLIGARDRIIVTGFVPDEDLAPVYSGALAFVYPSLYEGFGLPPLEAMQCGIPVITSNVSSLPEVVGDAGLMVPPKDSDALCAAMLRIWSDSTLASALAEKSLRRAKEFTWERCGRETIAAYKQALAT